LLNLFDVSYVFLDSILVHSEAQIDRLCKQLKCYHGTRLKH